MTYRTRRNHTPEYKRAILEEYYERCPERGDKSALLRREGLSGGLLVRWRWGKENVHGSRAAARRARLPPRAGLRPFPLFVVHKADEHGSQAALARWIGVSTSTINRLVTDKRPTEETLKRLRAKFGDEVPPIATAEEERRERFAKMLERRGLTYEEWTDRGRAAPARKKAGQTQRGKRRGSSDAGKAAQRKRVAKGTHPISADMAAKVNANRATPVGFADWYLPTKIGKLARLPDRATLLVWANVVAARYPDAFTTAENVMEHWRPALRRRGVRIDGCPPNEKRCQEIEDLRTEYDQLKPHIGFWPWAVEPERAPAPAKRNGAAWTAEGLRLAHRSHLKACTRLTPAV